ncbi:MAG: MBL fold metallo-hydrolase [Dehalococcoidales bacterium]|nr:MBL fold metallo-hydrolase [Dehalococcoidales bacterium]
MIIDRVVVSPFDTNCYIVGSEKSRQGIIIDPGDEAGLIMGRVADLRLDIKSLVLTHGHIDHVGALKAVKEATGAEMAIHADDAKSLRGLRGFLQSVLVPGLSYPVPPPPERLLQDGDSLDVSDLHFQVLHTPGHTPGGICLLGEGVVFTGDTLFNCSIGRSDLPGGSYRQLIESIHTKLLVLPDNTVVYPGHGPETTIGAERAGNPFLSS